MADEVVGVLDDFIEVSKDDAGLDGGRGVLKADGDDVVEGTHVEDDARFDGGRATHDAGAAAVWNDGHAGGGCGAEDLGYVGGGFRANDGERECLLRYFPVAGGDGVAGVVLKGLRVGQDVVPADDLFDFEKKVVVGHVCCPI